MPQHGSDQPQNQKALPFAEAEGIFDERLRLAGLTIARMPHKRRYHHLMTALRSIRGKVDLHFATFVRKVFNFTAGGIEGELLKSYEELTDVEFLCCSKAKVRSTVDAAVRRNLINRSARVFACEGQRANAYTICWAGIARLTGGVISTGPGALTEHGGALTEHGGALTEHAIKEYKASCNALYKKESGSGPEAVTVPRCARTVSDGGLATTAVLRSAGVVVGTADNLRSELFAVVPLLSAASTRSVDPLPVGRLVEGTFHVLQRKHLGHPPQMIRWYRMQLALPSPPLPGATEADVLLVLASARYAVSLPDAEVTRNRVALFVSTVTRRKWRRCQPHVGWAREALDAAIAELGEGVIHGAWPERSEARP